MGENKLYESNLIQAMTESVKTIRENVKVAYDK